MAKNSNSGGIPANATESINVPASGGRGRSVDFSRNRQSYSSDLGGGMGASEDMSRIPSSGRGKNAIAAPKLSGGWKRDAPDSVSFDKI